MALLRSALTVGGYTMMSRVLGFVRDVLVAAYLGAGPVADAFFVAFKLPNFFRSLFAEGAFNAAFVPMFSAMLGRDGRGPALAFAERALALLVAAVALFVALCQIFMPYLMLGLAPGFSGDPARFDLAVSFTRVTFPYLFFISLVSLLGGVLNSIGRFAAAAAAPVLLNLTLIGSLLVLAKFLPTPGHALAVGVSLAGMVQFLWLVGACQRSGIHLRLPWPSLGGDVSRLLRLIMPAALGAGVVQVNLVIGVILASLLPQGAISYLFYADRLNQLPIGVVGVAVGTALLPLLSRQIAAGDNQSASDSQNRAIELVLLLAAPATAALVAVPRELIGALFERGAFGAVATVQTAAALTAYAAGLPAYVLIKALAPGFYARHDTATPVRIAVLCIAANLAVSLALMPWLAHVGLALATAVAAWLNAGLLAAVLWRRGLWRPDVRLKQRAWRILAAAAAMAAALLATARALAAPFAAGGAPRIGALIALVLAGGVIYALAAQAIGAARVSDLKALLRRQPAAGPAAPAD
jgi:putative peptidoglycan lipid II flippase